MINSVIKVQNMIGNNGREIPNQFIIDTPEAVYFQSYRSIIAKKDLKTGRIYLDRSKWDYSTTTGKYRNLFLMEPKKETEKKIKAGEYILEDLN